MGLKLAFEARELGVWALVLFAAVHWLCDLVWLTILTHGAFHGTNLLGAKFQRPVFALCGLALAGFGLWFLLDAVI